MTVSFSPNVKKRTFQRNTSLVSNTVVPINGTKGKPPKMLEYRLQKLEELIRRFKILQDTLRNFSNREEKHAQNKNLRMLQYNSFLKSETLNNMQKVQKKIKGYTT